MGIVVGVLAFVHHVVFHRSDGQRSAARLWRSVLATLLYAGMMTFFGVRAFTA